MISLDEAFRELLKSGPWAALAAIVLWKLLGAWTEDRKTIATLLKEFREAVVSSIAANTRAVEQNIVATNELAVVVRELKESQHRASGSGAASGR